MDLEEDSIIEESVIQRVESPIGGSAERERLRRKKVCYIVIGVVDMILGGTRSQNQKKMWEMITITGVSNSWNGSIGRHKLTSRKPPLLHSLQN